MKTPLSPASFFTIEAREYENFTFDAGDATTVRLVIIGLCVGIVVASLYTLYQRSVPGGLVRKLLSEAAFSPETAKTLTELGYGQSAIIKYELRHNTAMQKLVRAASDGEENTANAPPAETDKSSATPKETDIGTKRASETRYYIPEELKYRAETRYESKGNGPLQFLLTVILSAGLAVLLIKLIPLALSMIDAIL